MSNTGQRKQPQHERAAGDVVPDSADVVLIGAGINSLGAALMLADAGKRVLVLDRNDEPGGAIRTLELTLPGFRHDIGAMNLSLIAGSPFYAEYGDALANKGFELVVADATFGSHDADGQFLGFTADDAANASAIAAFSPDDERGWRDWRDDYDRLSPLLFQLFGSPATAASPLDLLPDAAGRLSPDESARLRGILLDSLRKNLGGRFENDTLRAAIAAWALHLDYPPDVDGGCWMPFLETNGDALNGIPIARGGSGNLVRALVELIEDRGGRVISGQEVERVLIERDRAVGVALKGGQEVRASEAVVASVTPQALLGLVDRRLPAPLVDAADTFQYGPGTLVVHLSLSGLPDWRDEAARRSFYVHVGPTLDYLAAAYDQSVAGQLPADPFIVVGQPTVYDPSRAPAGRHVLWLMARCVPARIAGDAAGIIDGREWTDGVAGQFADRVIDRVEELAPGLRDRILGMAVHTPADLESLNPNLVGGDLNAGSLHLPQFYGNRPFPGHANNRLPVAGLFLCGASTWPGGGAAPGSGVLVAREILGNGPA